MGRYDGEDHDETYYLKRDLKAAAAMIASLKAALKPLAIIADEYDTNGLDEARPEWEAIGSRGLIKGPPPPPEKVHLYSGRGGNTLLTLADCMKARDVLTQGKTKGS